MNEFLQEILGALVSILCLLIMAGGMYLVAIINKRTKQIDKQIDNETASKYIYMASDAVTQAVIFTAQTFVDALKSQNAFTLERQLEAFTMARDKALEILGDTAVAALNNIYGDFDAWLETRIEQECWSIKAPVQNVDDSPVLDEDDDETESEPTAATFTADSYN